MYTNKIILKNDLIKIDPLKIMSLLQEFEFLYKDFAIIETNLSDCVVQYCKAKNIKLLSGEYKEKASDKVIPLSSHFNNFSFSILKQNNIDTINEKFELYVGLATYPKLIIHSKEVALECYKLGELFSIDPIKCYIAGLLHDVGGIINTRNRVLVADTLGIELFEEERVFPLIIHQKLSAFCAQVAFDIKSNEIIDAIGCHTTLRKDYSLFDLIVFVADKIRWDQEGTPPYLEELKSFILEKDIERAAKYYIDYIMSNDIKVYHPWIVDAQKSLESRIKRK